MTVEVDDLSRHARFTPGLVDAFFAEWPDCCPAKGADIAKTAQSAAEIACQGANICALAAFSFQHGMIRVGNINELQSADLDRPRCKFHLLSVTGEIVSPLSVDLDR